MKTCDLIHTLSFLSLIDSTQSFKSSMNLDVHEIIFPHNYE
jgi:hypothetical protein